MKLNRLQIETINNTYSANKVKNRGEKKGKSVDVPDMATFSQIYEKAKKGNEMAIVILDEWNRFCIPKNEEEKKVMQLINKAIESIFK